MKATRVLKSIARRLLLAAALTVISIALLVSLGREAIVNLDNYRTQINFFVSEQLAMQVETGQLLGDWQRLKPRITALDLKLFGDGGQQPAVSVDRITLEVDILKTLFARQLVLSELWIGDVALTLTEDAEGHWRVAGLPRQDRQTADSTALLDMLLDSNIAGVGKVAANLLFYSGTEAGVEARDILLENQGSFHRLLAGLSLAGHTPVAELIVEARGDHRDMGDLSVAAYLKINRIDFSGSLSALAKGWFPEAVDRVGDIRTDIEGDIWIDMRGGGPAMLKGRLSAAEIPLNWVEDVEPLTRFSTDLTGWFKPGENWGLRLQNLDFDWGTLSIEPLTINYLQKVGASWGEGSVAVSQINLSLVDDILAKTGLAPASVLEALGELQPAGSLRNAHLDLLLNDRQTKVNLRANLSDLAISSWRGAPASRQINGYIEATNHSGLLELDSQNGFAIHYPQVFDDYMEHSSFRGQVRWRWDADNRALKIASGTLAMGGEEGIGRAHLYLDIPIGKPESEPEMYLLLGIRDSHTRYLPRYLPDNLDPGLLAWLEES
ncbi:YhdP family protein, partial [Porticoccus sp.]|uniref:YhdP family protein n=1 Tax=Porticoccus sp. TaxID=2024853 RepID=UPI003F6960F8